MYVILMRLFCFKTIFNAKRSYQIFLLNKILINLLFLNNFFSLYFYLFSQLFSLTPLPSLSSWVWIGLKSELLDAFMP